MNRSKDPPGKREKHGSGFTGRKEQRSIKDLLHSLIFEESPDLIDNWRVSILNFILYGVFILSVLSAAAGINNQVRDGRYHFVIYYLICVLAIAATTFLKTVKFRLRVSLLLLLFYLIAVSELFTSGITGDGDNFMTALVVLAGILLNTGTGLAVFIITILTMILAAGVITGGYVQLAPFLGEVSYRSRNWASAIFAYTFMTAVVYLSTVFMRRKMEESIREKEKSILDLERENRIRKKREQSLKIFKQLLTTSYNSIAYIDRRNRVRVANDTFNEIFGRMKGDHNPKTKGMPAFGEAAWKLLTPSLKRAQRGENLLFEQRMKKSDGEEIHLEIFLSTFAGKSVPDGVVFVGRDITDKVKMEQDILEMNEEGYRSFSLVLHDGLSHFLLDISFQINHFINRLKRKNRVMAEKAGEIEEKINQAIELTRGISRGLFPPAVSSLNLRNIIDQKKLLLEGTFKINCMVEADPKLNAEDRTAASHLSYILQEAVMNIIKHSKAKEAGISLRRKKTCYEMIIFDNGNWPKGRTGQGTGRRIMNYRAKKIGGSVSCKRSPGNTTRVICRFPLSVIRDSS